MKRNFDNYAKLGHEVVQKHAQYDLTQEEMIKGLEFYEEARKKTLEHGCDSFSCNAFLSRRN